MIGPDGVKRYVAATGTGPVDAVYKADSIIGVSINLESYTMSSVTEGIEVRISLHSPFSNNKLCWHFPCDI